MGIRHFRTLLDLDREALLSLIDRAIELKRLRGTAAHPKPLLGKSIVVLLEKASTRTRLSFEIGIAELGAHPVTLIAKDTQLGRGEPLEDTARMLSGYAHGVVYRTFGHERVETLAKHASIPVVNGLSDEYHPCQLLADLMTVKECIGTVEGVTVAWVGDGNNMANSWILAAALVGFELRIACPEGYDPLPAALKTAAELGRGSVTVTRSVAEAVAGADVVTTDVWASMGQEDEARARAEAFADYIVDDKAMAAAAKHAVFLHCLPAHRGEEVAASVIDGSQSRVFQEAENRLHAQKALLERLVV